MGAGLVVFGALLWVACSGWPVGDEVLDGPFYPHVKHGEVKRHRGKEEGGGRFLEKSLMDLNLKYCQRNATCVKLKYATCMGSKLPYESSSLDLTDLESQEEIQEKLQLYQYLRYVPKCWAVIQPFLCALYMPKCENGLVDLPSKEMCTLTLGPCKILYNSTIFPEFLKCSDETLFPSKCKNDIHELKFNTTGYCMEPLVKTDSLDWSYPEVEGCGLRCKDSLYTESEQRQIHKLVAYCVLFCIFLHGFTVVTFLIDWKTANKYPALAIFYINVCFLVSYCGWLIQFLGNETREDIVCKKDGTLRRSEPSASENLSCVVIFVMVYYFLIAGMVWFVVFAYAWHMSSLQALGKIQERVDKKRAYFHLIAWSLPLILTITTMALGEIDGDYISGICFVGLVNPAAKTGLLLIPLAAFMAVAGYIITSGLILLIRVKIESREIISVHSSSKIRSNIVRMGVFALFMFVFSLITFIYHGYHSENSANWSRSLHNYIVCKLTSLSSDHSHCRLESRPSVAMLQLQLLAVFGAGVAMASWIWCSATLHSWARYLRRKFHCELEEPIKLQKHRIIAEAFAKRKKLNQGGRISIEFQKHTDPVGLNFDLNSAASNELSTTWAANLPRLVNRRGAVPNEATCSVSSNNQSIDSEMSYSVRRVSIESRRNSGDSQLSVQISELTATRKVTGRHHRNRSKPNRYTARKKRDFKHHNNIVSVPKHNSNTSINSTFLQDILNTAAFPPNDSKTIACPNLERREGNAGLDGAQIKDFLSSKFTTTNGNGVYTDQSPSEDENISVTISESKFNMVVSNVGGGFPTMDLNDHLTLKSLKKAPALHIEEIQTESSEEDVDGRVGRGRDSKNSRRRSKKKMRYSSESLDNSSQELKQLMISSLNSGNSIVGERNRDSKQSKTSIDVACQANAHDIVNQTSALEI